MTQAKDLSHLLSKESKRRKRSPLKNIMAHYGDPEIVFLGGGMPLPSFFPWTKFSAVSPAPPFNQEIGSAPLKEVTLTEIYNSPEVKHHENDIPLANALQYGTARGQPQIVDFIKEHTSIIHKIPYENWDVAPTVGNSFGWYGILRTFMNEGDVLLVEEFTFPSSLEAATALGLVTFPIPIDDFGIVPEKLEEILDNWVGPKPKLLNTIPTGQNPTGSCLSVDRRKAIYKLAQKHDFIIVEDEPYYFLQMDEYTEDVSERVPKAFKSHEEFINSLTTSFLELDVDGRVLRIDSLSKVIAPGSRYGWITGQKEFVEKLMLLHENSIQSPSGFTQTVINGLLQRWGQSGYLDWLMKLRGEYSSKRDVAIDAIIKNFPKEVTHFHPPVAGMFFTVQFDASKHPKFDTEFGRDPIKVETALYERGLIDGALLVPGSWFKATGQTNPPQKTIEVVDNTIFYRGTYAAVTKEELVTGLERFGKTIYQEFGLSK